MPKCSICFEEKNLFNKYKCNSHGICDDCFNNWHIHNNTCPICREFEIITNQIQEEQNILIININENYLIREWLLKHRTFSKSMSLIKKRQSCL